MKKILLSSLSIVVLLQAHAQITLTANTSTPQPGDDYSYNMTTVDLSNFLQSQSGMNQTWDLSNLDDATTQEYNYNFVPASGLNYTNLFPNCSVGVSNPNGQIGEVFYETNSTGIRNAGTYVSGSDVYEHTEGLHLLKFPLTYNTVYTDSIKGGTALLVSGGMEFERKGISTLTGDGYGDLILPYGTVHDVLRVKIERSYQDFAMGMSLLSYNEISYYFYTNYNRNFIASTNHLSINGIESQSILLYQSQSSFNNFSTEDFTPSTEVSIYPNPAIDQFTVTNFTEGSMVSIFDIRGNNVKTVSNSNIDISDLSSGYYMVHITNPSGTQVQKLIVQ